MFLGSICIILSHEMMTQVLYFEHGADVDSDWDSGTWCLPVQIVILWQSSAAAIKAWYSFLLLTVPGYAFVTQHGQRRLSFRLSIRSFVRTDIVTTISHERLEQSWWNIQGITISLYWWPDYILMGHRSRSHQAVEVAKASTLMLGHRSPVF